jgi:nucleoside-diphosphate-sugar epimerase
MGRSVLVTGGAGAIGSRLAKRLVDRGDEVTVIDNLNSGFRDNVPGTARFVEASIVDEPRMEEVFRAGSFTQVFHLAALFANQNSVEHPLEDLTVNAKGTLLMLLHAQRLQRQRVLERFVYVSSSCVYGVCEGAENEDAPFHPETPYAITKMIGEKYCRYLHHAGVPTTTVRLFNSYGPGERPGRYRNVIPNFIRLALKGEPLTVTGNGEETRDFTFVDDVVEGIVAAAESPHAVGHVYNLSTGRETQILHLAREIIRLTGSSSEIRFAARRSWDKTLRRCGDSSRAQQQLGFVPRTRLEDGLARTVEWLRSLEAGSA